MFWLEEKKHHLLIQQKGKKSIVSYLFTYKPLDFRSMLLVNQRFQTRLRSSYC